jgi:hypothetical protein
MFNLFYFSSYVKPAIVKIKFAFVVLARSFRILFRRDKQLTPLNFNYSKKYQFDQSLVVIQYQFENVLWYHFKGIKRATEPGVIVLNLSKITKFPIEFVIRGLFRKKLFLIDVTPEATMQTNTFRTKINQPRDLKYCSSTIALCIEPIHSVIPKIKVSYSPIKVKHSPISMKNDNLHFEYPSFNQTEFL